MKSLRFLLAGFFFALTAAVLTPASLRAQDNMAPDTTTGTTAPDATTGTDATTPDATTPDATSTDTTDTADNSGSPSFDYFYNALQDYGQWVQIDPYGYCWQPTAAQDPNWQPYTDGYWAYTDAGWTWVSYEDFGWITYHYGRWAQVQDVGWVWVPDYQWAPAWVSWRQSADAAYIGWAPLPPECQFQAGIGFSFGVDVQYGIGPGFYNFCHVRDFGAPVLGPVIINRNQNVVIIASTTNITNITTNNNVVFNGGPNFLLVSARVAHPIPALQLVRQTNPGLFKQNGPKGMLAQARGNQLLIAAPLIVAPKQPFKPLKVAKVISSPVITKGWAGIDPKKKLQLQATIKTQAKGFKPNMPARPVTAAQLAIVPKGPAAALATPGGKPTPPAKNLKPFVTGNPTPTPPGKPHPHPSLAPFNNPNTEIPTPKATPPRGTPPPKTPQAGPNEAALEQQKAAQEAKEKQLQLEQEKAAAAAAARRQQQTPPPQFQPKPGPGPGPATGFPGKGGKPTPTPTPH